MCVLQQKKAAAIFQTPPSRTATDVASEKTTEVWEDSASWLYLTFTNSRPVEKHKHTLRISGRSDTTTRDKYGCSCGNISVHENIQESNSLFRSISWTGGAVRSWSLQFFVIGTFPHWVSHTNSGFPWLFNESVTLKFAGPDRSSLDHYRLVMHFLIRTCSYQSYILQKTSIWNVE